MSIPSDRFAGKVALVTGGASGIGRATVFRLLAEGASVVFADLNLDTGSQTLQAASEAGFTDQVRFFPCDAMQESDMEHAVRFTCEIFGQINHLVNCASTSGDLNPLLDTTVEGWDKSQQLIGRSVFLGIKYAAKEMVEQQQGGSIVSVASVAGHVAGAGSTSYSAAKAGIINLTQTAAMELAKHRIRVNSISPGLIMTPLLFRGFDEQEFRDAAVESQVWPEPGEPEDVAASIAFLLSEDAKFVTGTDLLVDGGECARGPDIYSGNHAVGNLITDVIRKTQLFTFDQGSTVSMNSQQSWEQQVEQITKQSSTNPDTKRVIMLTGVSRGLGRALAEQLIEMGHIVIGCARSEEAIQEMESKYQHPQRCKAVDVTNDESLKDWIDELEQADAIPDLVINNAAISNTAVQLWRFDATEIENVLKVNVLGTTNVLRHMVPRLLTRRKGVIINFSSGWGRDTTPKAAPYCASKWAIEGLTRALASELSPQLAVVSLHPGIIRTKMMEEIFGEAAVRYPDASNWAKVAAPYLLSINVDDNGRQLAVPGMTNFYGLGKA